jgi:hypothetical protein
MHTDRHTWTLVLMVVVAWVLGPLAPAAAAPNITTSLGRVARRVVAGH